MLSSYDILMQRQQKPINDANGKKFVDIVQRLEAGLFKIALTKVSFICIYLTLLFFFYYYFIVCGYQVGGGSLF